MARPSKKAADKQELADRLGVPVTDILTRDEVAALMVPPATKDAITKNPDAYPPFVSAGPRHIALYPRAWVEEHLRLGKVMGSNGRLLGRQPWPPTLPQDARKRANTLALLDLVGVARGDESYRKSVLGEDG